MESFSGEHFGDSTPCWWKNARDTREIGYKVPVRAA